MQSVITVLRALQVPYRPNVAKHTFSFESLPAFLQAVRKLSQGGSRVRLDVVDEGVGTSHQVSLFYTLTLSGEKLYLRITDDPARYALKAGAGLFDTVHNLPRTPGSRLVGWASFDASHPIDPTAVNRVLHGLPAEALPAKPDESASAKEKP